MRVADEILIQLGGRKFIACTGCKNFRTDGDCEYLLMDIPKNRSKANRLEIKYNRGADDYTMRFFRHRNANYNYKRYIAGKDPWTEAKDTEVKTYEHIYCDQLTELFAEVTGMIIPYKVIINTYVYS